MAAPKTNNGEIEANPAPKYEDVSGPQRVGADTGTAYPITGEPPKTAPDPAPPEGVDANASEEAIAKAEKTAAKSSKKS